MECPECNSTHIRKNGHRRGKQNYICVNCARQFLDAYSPSQGYSATVKQECLLMYLNGMGFRGIQRVKQVHHTTVINWVKKAGANLPDTYNPQTVPEVGELDELETFVGAKKTKSGSGQPLTTSKQEF